MASVKIGDLYYELNDATSTAAVTYEQYIGEFDKNYKDLTDVVVPSTVTYSSKEYTVTTIDEWAFSYANHIKTIQLPSTITTIGHHAFNNDTALTEITIPEGVTVLKEGVLSRTYALTNVKLPSTIEKIERQAFMSAMKLETITLPAKVSMIYQEAFYYCQSLKSIIYKGTSKPSVGTDAFKYTPAEFTFYVPCGTVPTFTGITTNIKDTMVYDINVTAEHATVKIDTSECKNVTISLENIDPAYAFLGWAHGETETSFDTVVIRDVNFTANFRKIPAVYDTLRYEYKGNNLYYKIYTKNETCKEVMIVNDGTPETYWTEANKPTGALVIPDSVEDWQGTKYAVAYMYSNAFRNCTGITSVDFSENKGLTYITSHGFEDCTALAEVTLSDYITTLNSYCFKGCTSLTAIDFKNVVTLSGPTNFWDCNIALVHITKSLKTIPDQTDLFDHATTITCDEENPYFVAVDNVLYSKDTTQIYGLPIGLPTAEIHVPTTVTKVLYAAFYQFEGTLFINSEIKPTWPSTGGDWRNSPKGDVIVGCEFYDYYDAWRGSMNNFQNITSLTAQLLWDVQATADANGSVALTDTANCNEVHITATPDAGYSFWKWSNGATTAEITLEVESDTAVTAFFHPLIGNVALTVTFPDKGAEILSNYHIYTPADLGWDDLCPDGANYHCVRILFYNGSGNYYDETALKPNTTYRALFWIAPNDGYDFPRSGEYVNINNITTTVNGQNRNDFASSKDYCIFGINFTTSIATGVENVQKADGCTQKLLRNGQLLILRNGEMYNAQGARVE